MKSTRDYFGQLKRLREELNRAEAVVIGAGAGLSSSAGFTYDGARFEKHFRDFGEKYRFQDMYSGAFYPFRTKEEHWAYWSRFVYVNRYMDPPKPVHQNLLKLVRDKDYFVITTNVDHCFQKAGFDKQRLFYTQGDYGLFQCSKPCHQKTYDNEAVIRRMVEVQQDMCIPTELIPKCPVCGRDMTMNLRSDNRFVEDEGWSEAARRYEDFLRRNRRGHILFLELGVGYNTPAIIKYPFWHMTAGNRNAFYACVNLKEALCPQEIRNRAVCLDEDIGIVVEQLLTQENR